MTLDLLKAAIEAGVPGCRLEIVLNPSPSGQHSLLIDTVHAVAVAEFLRDTEPFRLDYCSNVTGVDWPVREATVAVKVKKLGDGAEPDGDGVGKVQTGGFLEAVYHLYSISGKHGPVILRMRTEDRAERVHLPSLTPVWRSAEFQEREIFDLYGIVFDGHPDLRRLLMWEGFADYPMRRDYVEPDDYEYEPTAHDEVLKKTLQHYERSL